MQLALSGLPEPEDCADGIDNDGDGLMDYPDDPGCDDATDASEKSASLPCDDGLDNEPTPDGFIDYRVDGSGDPGCHDPAWYGEAPQCQDGLNNDFQRGI